MQRSTAFAWLALSIWLASAGSAAAQVGEQGSITGTLSDAQGGVLPGVSVAATNTSTNVTRTAVTTEAGVYLITGLAPATYKVTFTLSSFKPSAREVEVRTGGNTGITDFNTFGTVASTQSNDPRFVMLTFKVLY